MAPSLASLVESTSSTTTSIDLVGRRGADDRGYLASGACGGACCLSAAETAGGRGKLGWVWLWSRVG